MKLNILLISTGSLLLSSAAFGQASATASATPAAAAIYKGLTLAKTANLDFGSVITGTSSGSLVLAPSGGVTTTGVTQVTGSTPVAAAFTATGHAGSGINITLPASPITMSDGASHTMTVSAFTSNPSGSGTLTGGTLAFNVGATLNVGANQAEGSYSGTFDVTVVYN